MKKIVWLSSYPKSGNTWLRTLLTNYILDAKKPAEPNQLIPVWAYNADAFERSLGVFRQHLTPTQINNYRPVFYDLVSNQNSEIAFAKIHDAYELNSKGVPIFPPSATKAALLIVRNPLDVAISYAHHLNMSIDQTIEHMADEQAFSMGTEYNFGQLPQRMFSWSLHTRSWLDVKDYPVKIVRYEDLIDNTKKVFGKIIKFSGLKYAKQRTEKAVEFSRFEVMKRKEKKSGFREKQPTAKSFFRKGKSGEWRTKLTKNQISAIIDKHGEVMKELGYLDATGEFI